VSETERIFNMKVDLTKAIEAYHPETGEVVPMKLDSIANRAALNYSFTTEDTPHGESNRFWRADGSCSCGSKWIVRNVKEDPEFSEEVVQEMWHLIQEAAKGRMIVHRSQTLIAEVQPTGLDKLAKTLGYSSELLAEKLEECGVRLTDD
tara:strand:+ start:1765 stop:2211 length:447 start_codon:yes stop_codon:yes gene_type:complete